MATKYGYVERSADSYVNWADVGRTMTSTIDAIQQEREDKKTLIDESYRSELQYIMEAPSGEHEGLRNWSLNYSQTAAENLKLQHQLFKQGKTRINDYTSFRQKITDNTDNLYKTIGGIQESFKEKMDRLKNGDSQNLEGYIMDQLTKYGDLSNTESIINPLTGDVTIALTEEVIENGQKIRRAVKDPTKRLTVNDLMASVNVKYDNYNPLADITKWVDGNGEVIQVMHELGANMKVGTLTEMKDVTWAQILEEYTAQGRPQNEIDRAKAAFDKFKESETSFAKSLIANPFNELAILTNQMKYAPNGKQYGFSEDPNHKGGEETILIERLKDGSIKPLLTDKQNAAALNHITTLAYGMYDKTKKTETYVGPQTPRPERANQPQEWQYRAGKGKADLQAQNDIIREAINSPDPQIREARIQQIQQMEGIDGNNTGVNASTGEFIVQPKDLDKPPIKNKLLRFENGEWVSNVGGEGYMSDKDFAAAVLLMSNPKTSMSDLEEYYNLTTAKPSQWDNFSPDMAIKEIDAKYQAELKETEKALGLNADPLKKKIRLQELKKSRDDLIKYQEERKAKNSNVNYRGK